MYKITLFDVNVGGCCSGVVSFFCDDLEKFEKEWALLETDQPTIDRFRKSKAGEIVTDYYSDDPELNIVQQDKNSKIYLEKKEIYENESFVTANFFEYETVLFANKAEFDIRYIKYKNDFLKIVKYKLCGVCKKFLFEDEKYIDVNCYGNPILKHKKGFSGVSIDKDLYNNEEIESICYVLANRFATEGELEENLNQTLTEEEISLILCDIPGEAG